MQDEKSNVSPTDVGLGKHFGRRFLPDFVSSTQTQETTFSASFLFLHTTYRNQKKF